MPSRLGVVTIALFWLATTGFVAYRDVWPHYFSDGPPPVRIEMTDEATTQIPAKWTLYWDQGEGLKKIGGASTELTYETADDTFWFKSEYRDLKFDVAGFLIEMANVSSDVRVNRAGVLKEQRFVGDITLSRQILRGAIPLAEATALLTGKVQDKAMTGRCRVWNPKLGRNSDRWEPAEVPVIDERLDPVPVPDGQVLNPLMPLGRVRGVRAGRTWVIREVNPLAEAISSSLRNAAKKENLSMLVGAAGRAGEHRRFVARVRSAPEVLDRLPPLGAEPRAPVPCLAIDYDGGEGVSAVTWVGVADGTVYRQEASLFGEKLRFERDY
jgi:hypothetical protein